MHIVVYLNMMTVTIATTLYHSAREREKLDRAQAKLARSQAQLANTRALQEAEARRALRDIQREVQMEEVSGREWSHCRTSNSGHFRLEHTDYVHCRTPDNGHSTH